MTRTDSIVVGTLVVLLALVAGLVGLPALTATSARVRQPDPGRRSARPGRTARASSGTPSRISPLTARSQADRDLVALIFSGLVRNGPQRHARARPGRHAGPWTTPARSGPSSFARTPRGRTGRRSRPTTSCSRSGPCRTRTTWARRPGRGARSRSAAVERPGRDVHPHHAARRLPAGRDPADRAGPSAGRCAGRRPSRIIRSGPSPSGPVRSPWSTWASRGRPWSRSPRRSTASRRRTPGASGDSLATPGPDPAARTPGAVPVGHRVHVLRRCGGPECGLPGRRAGRGIGPATGGRGRTRDRAVEPTAALPERDADGRPARPATRASRILGPGGPHRPAHGHRPGHDGRHRLRRRRDRSDRARSRRARPCSTPRRTRRSPTTGRLPARRCLPLAGSSRTTPGTARRRASR